MKASNRPLAWLAVLIIIVGAIWILGNSMDSGSDAILTDTINSSDWTKGNPDAGITIIEYGDYQCPACASVHPLMDAVIAEFEQHIHFAYRHFPLSGHKHAKIASQAAEAAGLQGKFWEMHDAIYVGQREWSSLDDPEETYIGYAENLQLDIEQFKNDLHSSEVKDQVDADLQSALANRLGGTPTIFVDGKQERFMSMDHFRGLIRGKIEALKAAESTEASTALAE